MAAAASEGHTANAVPVPRVELEDPDVLTDEEVDVLLERAPWRRFVVVGDSIAKGVGDESLGYRTMTWGERVAAALDRARPGLEYLNLGTMYQTAAEIRDHQLEAATSFEPDLAAYVGGGNDMLVAEFDIEPVAAAIDETVGGLAATGATVVTFSMLDLPSAFPGPHMEELERRLRAINESVAEIADAHGAIYVDLYSLPCCADRGLYSADMQHGSMRGQAIVASHTLARLAAHVRTGER